MILYRRALGGGHRPAVLGWALWSIPRPAQAFILMAELAAAVSTVGLLVGEPPTPQLALRLSILLALSIGYSEIAKRSERIKRYLGAGSSSPRPNPMSVWSFAALLALPAGWAAGFIAVQYGHALFQRWRDRSGNPYRVTFTASAAVLGQLAGAAVLDESAAGGVLRGQVTASLSVLAAAGLFTLTDFGVLLAGMWLTVRPPSIRAMLPDADALGYEFASLALGIGTAEIMLRTPAIVAVLVIPVAYLQRSSMVKMLHQALRTDSKTGLLNTAAWTEHATGVASRCARNGQPIAVLMIDVDRFKTINDTRGHLHGDQVLVAVAGCLRHELRGHDRVGRFGGDEFVVVLDELDLSGAEQVGNRLRSALGAIRVEGVSISVSIGLAHTDASKHQADIEQLLQSADSALYQAKSAGRDRVCVASTSTPA